MVSEGYAAISASRTRTGRGPDDGAPPPRTGCSSGRSVPAACVKELFSFYNDCRVPPITCKADIWPVRDRREHSNESLGRQPDRD